MITRTKIDEWIRQVEATPVLAPILIRQITDRFLELDAENETLRAENLELSTGNKVRQLEHRISELEFQLDLLKRRSPGNEIQSNIETTNLLVYNDRGQLLRLELADEVVSTGQPFARIGGVPDIHSHNFGLLPAASYDQLLLIFSSGRTAVLPSENIPVNEPESLEWAAAYQIDLRSQEELVWILPITKLHTYDHCIQVSRFGYARRIDIQYFKTFLTNNNIGKGVKFNFDRILNLVLCNNDQLLVLVSKAGNCTSIAVGSLPVSLDEVMHLKVNDYVIAALVLAPEDKLVAVSPDSLAFAQNQSWILPAKAGEHGHRQFFPSKRETITLAGAVSIGKEDRLLTFYEDGTLWISKPENLSGRSTLLNQNDRGRILALATLISPHPEVAGA